MTISCFFSVFSVRSVVKYLSIAIKKILKYKSRKKLRALAPARENLKVIFLCQFCLNKETLFHAKSPRDLKGNFAW
ncbi:hypothetical protein LNTAR_04951 [Lentisphaera araneosa HTCC2155]|uniref:Uncharacterized protein n=1 Tax=Lentisphaera araneosa HTCC2155 TaxID=313628 RepID=A6DLH7_9BACT|nr:hypothetical protein LNTAR_04951 [Lentisphaera araneosa HTCC2155]